MESASSHVQSGTASKARARAMSDHTMIGSLGARSTSTPANRPKSANGSASSAVRTPISSGVASSSRAPVSGSARKVICPPKWVMVSELHSRTKSPLRHSPLNARVGFSRRSKFAIVFRRLLSEAETTLAGRPIRPASKPGGQSARGSVFAADERQAGVTHAVRATRHAAAEAARGIWICVVVHMFVRRLLRDGAKYTGHVPIRHAALAGAISGKISVVANRQLLDYGSNSQFLKISGAIRAFTYSSATTRDGFPSPTISCAPT